MSYESLFADQADKYARYRPTYPRELFVYLAESAPSRRLAWDCATGNGQAAIGLAEFFNHVIATDASEEQLSLAKPQPRVNYRKLRAEDIDAVDASVDLVTVAQALHWLDLDRFFPEVQRVLRPGGIFAAWCYQLFTAPPEIERVLAHFYHDVTGPYWSARRTLVDEGYKNVDIPIEELKAPPFAMTTDWSAQDVLGYFSSWSAVLECRRRTGRDVVSEIQPDLLAAWGDPKLSRTLHWPLAIRVGRKKN